MSKQLSEQDTDKLNKWIKGGKRKKYTQLYSAASNGCNASTFHTNCDNNGPTVTLVYNTNGSVYGGYSSVSWMSGSGESVYDGDAFLFLLTGGIKNKSCKFTIKSPEYALTMDKDCGPSFGKGPDLLTFKDDVSKYADFFHLKSVMLPDSYKISEKTIKEITDGIFDAKDVVVYAVEDVAEEISLPTPWRKMDLPTWDSELLEILKRDIEEYWPLREMGVSEDAIPYVNVLLLGPVGSGKSSFFNTLNSIFRGRVSIQARAGSSDNSLTKSFHVYSIVSNHRPLRFRICDCRGFEDAHEIDQFDIDSILDGNIKDKYKLVDKSRITRESPFYRRDPKMHDRIHCVAIVVDSNNDPDYPMTDRVQEQMNKTQELMNQKGIPQLILMTKIDCLSETVKLDLSRIFHSPDVKDRVEKLAHSLRLPPYTVLPMKNIDSEQRINENVNILALYNLRQMLRAADDFLLNYLDEFLGDKFEPNFK
ncbi:unnamed protein product [Mytilus coruscus]|uniref:TLDc domain-containing protein n=1 Tax=Mytilus coruscus TaxID=42192 RepID=A0A6J8DK68_MYTCO|nr:unnamed protein product [Mytilus coruscus]